MGSQGSDDVQGIKIMLDAHPGHRVNGAANELVLNFARLFAFQIVVDVYNVVLKRFLHGIKLLEIL